MPLNIRDEVVNQLAEKLAARKRTNKTGAVRTALESELRRLDEAIPLRERLRPLQERVMSRPTTGLEADTVCWGAVATLLYGAAVLRSGPGLPSDQNAPTTIDPLRVGGTALQMWRQGKAMLHQELAETYPIKAEWKWG